MLKTEFSTEVNSKGTGRDGWMEGGREGEITATLRSCKMHWKEF